MDAEKSLLGRVRDELQETGFPLELEVGQRIRQAEWPEVLMGGYFTDPDTTKLREYDIAARVKDPGGDRQHEGSFNLVVECKATREQTWVGLRAPAILGADFPVLRHPWRRVPPGIGRSALSSYLGESTTVTWPKFLHDVPLCNSVRSLFSKKDNSAAYNAARSVVAAARGLETAWSNADEYRERSSLTIPVCFPLVVTESPLFLAWLDEGGLQVKETQCLSVFLGDSESRIEETVVTIVRPEVLPEIAGTLLEDGRWVARWVADRASLLAEAHYGDSGSTHEG
jgi:hypothetical protein